MRKNLAVLMAVLSLGALVVFPYVAAASHAWGGYHWARTSNPFTLKLGDNVSSTWDGILATTSADWSLSSVLDTTIVAGSTNPKNCRPVSGRAEVCNAKYGKNGWLGIAQIWLNSSGHITAGVTKMNDTYFSTPSYNTTAWRNLVMCQEVGHVLGLDHQDENFNNPNLGTCMDYTSNPESNQHPNAHDYEELEAIYAHLDSTTTISQGTVQGAAGNNGQDDWGRAIRTDPSGRPNVFAKDLGNGMKQVTWVYWGE